MGDWIAITKDSGHQVALNMDALSHVDEDTGKVILYFNDGTRPQEWAKPSGEVTALKAAIVARI